MRFRGGIMRIFAKIISRLVAPSTHSSSLEKQAQAQVPGVRIALAAGWMRVVILPAIIFVCMLATLGSEGISQGAPAQGTAVIQVVIAPTGFRQSTVVQKAGWIYLCVFNRAIRNGVKLRLDQQAATLGAAATRLRDVTIDLRVQDWRESIYLDPGTYLLTEAGHPTWICKIVIH
jgi:hypothetical protein